MEVVGGKWEIEHDARMGVNVCRAVLAGLYIIPLKFLLQRSQLKKSAFSIRSPSLYFQFFHKWRLSI
jgi:hypothetical protein